MVISTNRQLAAILFADIAGYTALMQKDEPTANLYLEKFHTTLNNKVAIHKGQVINNYGDGCVCTFDSAVDAMHCAKAIQIIFQTEPKVPVRIGLHSGDVFFKDDNVFGDSVNIASRIESLGVAGAVLFSKRIKIDIDNQTDFKVQSLGGFDLRNVERSMEIFALANEGFAIPKRSEMRGKTTKKSKWLIPIIVISSLLLAGFFISDHFTKETYQAGKISLAVVPFRNISGDENNSHYGMGMASEIRTKLSLSKKFEHLSSLQATATYANSDKTPKEIGEELDVDYLVMGLFQIAGADIRVNVELLDVASGKSVEEIPQYQNKFTDIFQVQSEIANQVLREFFFFNQNEEPKSEYTPNILAYSHYLKGRDFLDSGSSSDNLENALTHFESAAQIDSNYLSPWVGQIKAMTQMIWRRKANDNQLREKLTSTMDYIETHFPESWEKNLARGMFEYHGLNNFEKGKQFLLKALAENPEDYESNYNIAAIYKRQLNIKEALFHYAKAKSQNPKAVSTWMEVVNVSTIQGDYQTAIETAKTSAKLGNEAGKRKLGELARANVRDMSIIPKEWESSYGNIFPYFDNYFNQQWQNCLTILDTTATGSFNSRFSETTETEFKLNHKAKIFHLLGNRDSSQYYAQQIIHFYDNHEAPNRLHNKAFALSILGKREESNAFIQSGVRSNGNWVAIDEEDLYLIINRMHYEIYNYILQEDYEKATTTLLAINEKYPNYGDYERYNTDPFYNRIKKDYPSFAKAVKELKLPEIVPFEIPLKN